MLGFLARGLVFPLNPLDLTNLLLFEHWTCRQNKLTFFRVGDVRVQIRVSCGRALPSRN